MKTIKFMEVNIHPLSMKQTLNKCEEFILSNKPHQHVVVNVAKIVNMQKDPQLKKDVENADLINIDGMGVVWGARFLGQKVPERVAGIDLFENLLQLSENKGYKVFFLGAKQQVLEDMVNNIKQKYPKLKIAGYINGYFTESENLKVANEIKKTKAQLLFVGISSPKKEQFICSQLKNTGTSFAMGVGGSLNRYSFDIFAGLTKRAPVWMQNFELEWFYRIMQEPRRMFMRYFITNSKFLIMVIKKKWN